MQRLVTRRGLNVLILKVIGSEDVNWLGSIRFTDAAGRPLSGIKAGTAP